MAGGTAIAASILVFGIGRNPFGYADGLPIGDRLLVATRSSLLVAIARLAKHRFSTPDDIDGGGLGPATARATLLQALLQNTLEQAALAIVVYCAWAVVMPSAWLSVIPLAATSFGLGRVLFFAGYGGGAPSRSLGFAMTFHPSVAMLAYVAAVEAASLLGRAGP